MPRLLALCLLGWMIAFFGSFLAFYLTPARDFGLAGGWNKVTVFMGWQLAATGLTLICLGFRWTSRDALVRRLAVIPSIGLIVLLTVLVVFFFWANFMYEPAPQAPVGPVTAPAPATDG